MAVNIIVGHKLNCVSKEVIRSIDKNRQDFLCDNIVVVPDRFSMVAEKLIFEVLNIKATFNIHVMGINKLAKKIIDDANLDCVYVDNIESTFILYRAIQKVKNNFLCFSKNISQGLLEKIKNALSLIRSSDVSVSELRQNLNFVDENQKTKMQDLLSVYEEYENLLDGRLDATNILKTFDSLIENSLKLQKTNIYFCGFDSFTKQGYEIIKKISKNCKNLVVGVLHKTNNSNSHIFDDEMYDELTSFFKNNNIDFQILEATQNLTSQQELVFKNVFGYNIKPQQNFNYAKIIEMPSKQNEIENVAKYICYFIKNKKCKYSDINIVTNSSYFEDIENIFDEYKISYYVDKNTNFLQIPLLNFIKYAFDVYLENYSQESIINFLSNSFCDIDKLEKNNIENFILENNIEYSKYNKLLEYYSNSQLIKLKKFVNELKNFGTVSYYIKQVKTLLEDFNVESQLNNLCNEFNKNNDLKNEKIYVQVLDKITSLNEKFENILNDEQISVNDFYELYLNALSDVNISQIPLNLDCVYVGDSSSSFFETKKYLFVLGANQDVLPTTIKDLGLISDKEIDFLSKKLKISPTVKMINRRNRFKLFDILSDAKQNLFVYYRLTDEDGQKMLPSKFVSDILSLGANKYNIADFEENFADDNYIEKIKFNNPYSYIALKNISKNTKQSFVLKNVLQNLGEFKQFNFLNKEKVSSGKSMLSLNKTKISQVESYYECPFKHFVKYGLKLVEKKDGTIKPNDFGNFLHEFCKYFVDYIKDNKIENDEQITKVVDKVFSKLTNKKDYSYFNDKENLYTKEILYNEVKRFAIFVCFEQKISNFKLFKTEFKFGDNLDELCVYVNNKKYSIVGIVDRIDKCDNYFRIIDYKTGSLASSNSKIENLYNGTKIQVYVYLKAIANKFNLKPFGAFYLPLNNAYLDSKQDEYKLQGYFIDDINLIEKADSTLNFENNKSKLFEVQYSPNKKYVDENIKKLVYSKNVTKQEMQAMIEYSIKIVEQAIKEILEGNTQISPISDCKFCEYKAICGIDESAILPRKINAKISPKTFLGDEDE